MSANVLHGDIYSKTITLRTPAGFETPPVKVSDCKSLLQITDVAGDEEECEVVNNRMDLFSTARYQFEER